MQNKDGIGFIRSELQKRERYRKFFDKNIAKKGTLGNGYFLKAIFKKKKKFDPLLLNVLFSL